MDSDEAAKQAYERLTKPTSADIEAYARLFSPEVDSDPEVERLKTQESRDISAMFFVLDALENLQSANAVRQSPVVQGLVCEALERLNTAPLSQMALAFRARDEEAKEIADKALSVQASKGGSFSKRGPSPTSARTLVREVHKAHKARTWNAAWSWLRRKSDAADNAIGDFKIIKCAEDEIFFSVRGLKKSVKSVLFADYWRETAAAGNRPPTGAKHTQRHQK
jgi:hypothetical protein